MHHAYAIYVSRDALSGHRRGPQVKDCPPACTSFGSFGSGNCNGARSCLSVRTQPLTATGAPSQTSTIPYHTNQLKHPKPAARPCSFFHSDRSATTMSGIFVNNPMKRGCMHVRAYGVAVSRQTRIPWPHCTPHTQHSAVPAAHTMHHASHAYRCVCHNPH